MPKLNKRIGAHACRTVKTHVPRMGDMAKNQSGECRIRTKKQLGRDLMISGRKIELTMKSDPNFPVIRWGRSVRFDLDEVIAYLKSQGRELQQ